MPVDAVKIPQNVYIEDRVVGPLTLRQVIIMTLGGGFSYLLFSALQKAYGRPDIFLTVLVWIPAAVSAFFALVKVNDLSLSRILLLMIERANKAPSRVWTPRRGITINVRFSGQKPVEQDQKQARMLAQQAHTENRIRELSTLLDRPIDTIETEAASQQPVPAEPSAALDDEVIASNAPIPRDVPVDRSRIAVDGVPANLTPTLSDLSLFRDIVSPTQQ